MSESGVPQGVFGSSFFLLYTLKLFSILQNMLIGYVNDSTLKSLMAVGPVVSSLTPWIRVTVALWQSPWTVGLEKIPTSQGLVTPLHICRVIPTPQLPNSPETLCLVPISLTEHWCCHIECRFHCIERHVCECFMIFTCVLWCFTSGSQCFTSVSWYFMSVSQCFMMFSESHNNRHRRLHYLQTPVTASAPAEPPTAAGIDTSATEIGDNAA